MGRRVPATGRLAVTGRRGERSHALSDVPRGCSADDCGHDWRRGVRCAPILSATATLKDHVVLVLDDYHVLEAKAVDQALTFLLEHLPPQMHLVIATREDPALPLARFRARDQMIELRITDF